MTDVPVNAGTQSIAAEPSLHRVMGPWLLLLFIVGDILGTGIYALTGQVAKQVGGVVWLPEWLPFRDLGPLIVGPGQASKPSKLLRCIRWLSVNFAARGPR